MSIARDVVTIGSATFLSRILGFIRDVAIAALFGAGALADAFFVAFQFTNLVRRLLTEGAINAALVPLYLRRRSDHGEADAAAYAGRLLGTATVALLAVVCFLALLMPAFVLVLAPGFHADGPRMTAAIEMGRLMLPYLAFAGPLAILMGVLNANKRFAVTALAAVIFNIVILAALAAIFALGTAGDNRAGRILAASVALAGICQLALVAITIWIARERVTPLAISFGSQIRRFMRLAIPGLVASGIPQITIIAGVMVASTSEHAVSWIYYANRLVELPLGIVGIAIGTVLVPAFTHAIQSGDRSALISAESRGLELALGLALPAAIALAVLADPIVRVLFEHGAFSATDRSATAAALTAFAFGLPGHVLVKAFSPILFAREDTATPMRAALGGFAVAIAAAFALMPLWGHVGIALAISVSGWISAAMLWIAIRRRIGFSLDRAARRKLPLIALAAAGMGIAIGAAQFAAAFASDVSATARVAALALLIILGLTAYASLLHAFRVVRFGELTASLRRRP